MFATCGMSIVAGFLIGTEGAISAMLGGLVMIVAGSVFAVLTGGSRTADLALRSAEEGWMPEALALISGHFQSGEPLPASLFSRLLAAKNFQSGMQIVPGLSYLVDTTNETNSILFYLSVEHPFKKIKS